MRSGEPYFVGARMSETARANKSPGEQLSELARDRARQDNITFGEAMRAVARSYFKTLRKTIMKQAI